MINALAAMKPGGALEPFSYDPGQLAHDQVEIAVEYCGFCHSDLSMIDNEFGLTQFPLVPGHEVCGRVCAIGDQVTQFKIGDLVGLGWHSGYCLKCTSCLDGDHNLCTTNVSTIIGHHGGFADKVRAQETSVIAIPKGMDKALVGPLLCGGITVFNPLLQFNIKPSDRVGVIGIGGLGHLALKIYHAWGCEVTAFTSHDSKLQEALQIGATHAVSEQDSKSIEALAGQFDYIISTVNVNLNWNLYLSLLKPKGRLHLVGIITEPLSISMFQLLMGQHSLSSSGVGAPAALNKLMEFSQLHNIYPVVESYHFNDVNKAVEHFRKGKAHYRIVLHW